MNNKSWTVAKTNFRNLGPARVITVVTLLLMLAQDIVYIVMSFFNKYPGESNSTPGMGNYLYLLVLFSAIFIPARNFRKLMNLGAKRDNFFSGCAVNYVLMCAAVSLAGVVLYYTYDRFMLTLYTGGTLNVLYWFGWIENGPVVAFLRQFAFLLFAASFTHTLTAMQDKWYGWATDIVLVAIISVFTPIAPLRAALAWFFNLIIFHQNAFAQIAACLLLSAAVYSLNKPILARKII